MALRISIGVILLAIGSYYAFRAKEASEWIIKANRKSGSSSRILFPVGPGAKAIFELGIKLGGLVFLIIGILVLISAFVSRG
jgi:hypothetical protein